MPTTTLVLVVGMIVLFAAAFVATGSLRGVVSAGRTPAVVGLVLAAVPVFLLLGSEVLWQPGRWWNLDTERNLPTAFSVSLVAGAALAAVAVGVEARRRGRQPVRVVVSAFILAFVLAVIALDDWLVWHEKLEGIGGQGWTTWYLPVPLIAALSAAVVATALGGRARWYIALAFLAWLAAGAIETFLWGSGLVDQDPRTMPVEEILEMLAPIALFAGLSRGVEEVRHESSSAA